MDRLERLVNLVIALRETRRPLTVEQIHGRVAGYEGDRDDAWRRMFERDKADLRDLGVPLRTERIDRFDETVGYRIDPEDYDLPSVDLTPAELTALALAVQLTGLSDDATPGLDKLAVDAGVPGAPHLVRRLPLEVGLDAPDRAVLTEALLTRRRATFPYHRGDDVGETPTKRLVEPLALVNHRGRWYLRAFDVDRAAERTFRLDRIAGTVRLVGEPGVVDIPEEAADPLSVIPASEADPIDAVVAASDDAAWAVARRARGAGTDATADGRRTFTVPVADADDFIAWLLDLGPDVELIGPAVLRDRLVGHLREVLRA